MWEPSRFCNFSVCMNSFQNPKLKKWVKYRDPILWKPNIIMPLLATRWSPLLFTWDFVASAVHHTAPCVGQGRQSANTSALAWRTCLQGDRCVVSVRYLTFKTVFFSFETGFTKEAKCSTSRFFPFFFFPVHQNISKWRPNTLKRDLVWSPGGSFVHEETN